MRRVPWALQNFYHGGPSGMTLLLPSTSFQGDQHHQFLVVENPRHWTWNELSKFSRRSV